LLPNIYLISYFLHKDIASKKAVSGHETYKFLNVNGRWGTSGKSSPLLFWTNFSEAQSWANLLAKNRKIRSGLEVQAMYVEDWTNKYIYEEFRQESHSDAIDGYKSALAGSPNPSQLKIIRVAEALYEISVEIEKTGLTEDNRIPAHLTKSLFRSFNGLTFSNCCQLLNGNKALQVVEELLQGKIDPPEESRVEVIVKGVMFARVWVEQYGLSHRPLNIGPSKV